MIEASALQNDSSTKRKSFRDASRQYPQESRNAYKKECTNCG